MKHPLFARYNARYKTTAMKKTHLYAQVFDFYRNDGNRYRKHGKESSKTYSIR